MRVPVTFPTQGLWRARCIERCTPGSGSGSGETGQPKGRHRAPGRLHRPSAPLICGFIDVQRVVGHRVELICQVLREQGLAATPRSYRSWRATTAVPVRVLSDAAVIDVLRGLRTAGPEGGPAPEVLYGRRKMTKWLRRNGFPDIGKRTVDRLMREEEMRGVVRGAQTRTTIAARAGTEKVRAADLLKRNFLTSAPNRA